MLVELKNGDTYNGRLANCNMFMNLMLKDVICTSRVSNVIINFKIQYSLFYNIIFYIYIHIYRMVIVFSKWMNVTYMAII